MEVLKKIGNALFTGLGIVGRTALLMPLVLAMVWVNFTVDVSGLFHSEQFETDIALAMIGGEALNNYDRMEERPILEKVATNIEEPYETLAFGSSRVLQLRAGVADGGSFFNCGVSSADLVDVMGLYYQFDRAGKTPETVILCLDPWLLSGHSYNRHPLSDKDLFGEFASLCLGIPVPYDSEPHNYEKYKALVSPSYLQGNLRAYWEGEDNYTPPAVVQGDVENQDTNIKLSDGSVLYQKDFRNSTEEEAYERALNDARGFLWMDNFPALDPYACGLFEAFVGYLQDEGVNVIFLLTPYHPLVYNYATENAATYSGFFATEPYYVAFAEQHDIPVYGSYNPFVTGTLEGEFFDGLHMREEALAHVFPGVRAVERQQAKGRAGSPWLWGRVPVEEDIAHEIVSDRYEIPESEELVREEDETFNGAWCYVFGRYVKPEEPPGGRAESGEGAETQEGHGVRLARYAVTQETGTIYRYDDNLATWVVDLRFPT